MRIAILIPVHGDTKALFTLCLSRMLIRTAKTRFRRAEGGEQFEVDLQVFIRSGSILPQVRQQLVDTASEWAADWVLWCDSDHTFPEDALLRLLSHKKTVVGCNYPRRPDGSPVAVRVPPDGRQDNIKLMTSEAHMGIEEAGMTGLGLCLVSMEAIKAAKAPLFAYMPNAQGTSLVGEDSWFFGVLRQVGYPLFIDHTLSVEIGHISEHVLTWPGHPGRAAGIG